MGTLTVNSDSPYQLLLNGVSIGATDGPALDLESSEKCYLVTAPGTTNYLADSANRNMTMKAALYGEGPMIFSGETVTADHVFEGLYLGGIDYSQGSAGESFTVSSYVTNLNGGR